MMFFEHFRSKKLRIFIRSILIKGLCGHLRIVVFTPTLNSMTKGKFVLLIRISYIS